MALFTGYVQIEGVGVDIGGSSSQYRFAQIVPSGANTTQYRGGLVLGAAVESTFDPLTFETRESDQVFMLPLNDTVVQQTFTRSFQRKHDLSLGAMTAAESDVDLAVNDHTQWVVGDVLYRGREAMRVKVTGASPLTVVRAQLGTRVQEHLAGADNECFNATAILRGRRVEVRNYIGDAVLWTGIVKTCKTVSQTHLRLECTSAGRWLESKIGHRAYAGSVGSVFGENPVYATVYGETDKLPLLEEMGISAAATSAKFVVLEDDDDNLYTAVRWGSNTDGAVIAFLAERLDSVEPFDLEQGDSMREVLTGRGGDNYTPFYRGVVAGGLESTVTYNPIDIFLMIALSGYNGSNYESGSTYHYDVLQHWGCAIPWQFVDISAWEDLRDVEYTGMLANRIVLRRGQALPQIRRFLRAIGIGIVINSDGQIAPMVMHDRSSTQTTVVQADFKPFPDFDRQLGSTIDKAEIQWGDVAEPTDVIDLRGRLWYPNQDTSKVTIDATDYVYGSTSAGKIDGAADALVGRFLWRPPLVYGMLDPSIIAPVGTMLSVTHAKIPRGDGTIGVTAQQMLVIASRLSLTDQSYRVTLLYLAHYLDKDGRIGPVAEVVSYDAATYTATVVAQRFGTLAENDTDLWATTGSIKLYVVSPSGEVLDSTDNAVTAVTATTVVFTAGKAPVTLPRAGDLLVTSDSSIATRDEVAYQGDSAGLVTYDDGSDYAAQYGE